MKSSENNKEKFPFVLQKNGKMIIHSFSIKEGLFSVTSNNNGIYLSHKNKGDVAFTRYNGINGAFEETIICNQILWGEFQNTKKTPQPNTGKKRVRN